MVNTKTLTTTSIVLIIVAIVVSFFAMFITTLFVITAVLLIASTVLSITSWVKSEKGSNLREIIVAIYSILLIMLLIYSVVIEPAISQSRKQSFRNGCTIHGGICLETCENGDIPNGICNVKGQQCCKVIYSNG